MFTHSMMIIYLSLVHTGSWGYLFRETPSIFTVKSFINVHTDRHSILFILFEYIHLFKHEGENIFPMTCEGSRSYNQSILNGLRMWKYLLKLDIYASLNVKKNITFKHKIWAISQFPRWWWKVFYASDLYSLIAVKNYNYLLCYLAYYL